MGNWDVWRRAAGLLAALVVTTGAAQDVHEPSRAAAPRSQFVAFYVPWETAALASLKAHVRQIDVFSPMWASLVSASGEVRWESDPEAHAVLAQATPRPKVMPLVSNAHDDIWDKAAAEAVVTDPAAGEAFAQNLIRQAAADGYAGYVMDFENLTAPGVAGYAAFLGRLRERLKAHGLEVWVTTTLTSEDGQGDLSRAVDAVVLMAYDQCWATSGAGPVAADAWIDAGLKARLVGSDPRRYVVALASYGYDWPQGRKAEVTAAPAAAKLAGDAGQAVAHEAGSNPHFSYQAADGSQHQVWWVDGADFARQRALVEAAGVRGVALWRMGLEDPALWSARAKAPAQALGPAATCEPLKAG
jgi:spore germination protein YaaH